VTEPDAPLPRVSGVQEQEIAAVYLRSCGPLLALLTVLGGSRAEAEEVAQDAFVKLLEHWSKVRDYDDVDAWLRTVAVRLLISRHRRRSVAALGLRRLTARSAVSTPGPTPARTDLDAALATLPMASRAVLLLHHVHDLPVDEVAALLGVPVGTVKSRLARGRAALAPLLSERTSS
jgi:RNA polymerase sigma-70 factor (ECF subfamily)